MLSGSGGADWRLHAALDRPLSGVTFFSDQAGWAVGSATLLATMDGGATWREQVGAVPPEGVPPLLHRVRFVTPSEGIAVGAIGGNGENAGSPLILYTSDAGTHWQVAMIAGGGNPALSNSAIEDACLTASGIAIAIGFGVSGQIALRSSDGGASWRDITDRTGGLPDQPHGVACVGDSLIWLVGGGSTTVLHSADAGDTWVNQTANTPPLPGEALAVAFSDARRGLVAGVGPFVIRTSDGGATWQFDELPSEIRGGLLSIQTLGRAAVAVGVDESDIEMEQPIAIVEAQAVDWRQQSLPPEVLTLEDVSLAP